MGEGDEGEGGMSGMANCHVLQGTVSVLVGCHSVVHSLLVLASWVKIYGRWPRWWQVVCIFLHDVGHWGLDYLDDYGQKKRHWRAGAVMAGRLFGAKGYAFCAGHEPQDSGEPVSGLYKADKYSWHIAPWWWLWLNCVAEPKIAMGYPKREAIRRFRVQVRQSVESGEYRSTHSMYLEHCRNKEEMPDDRR